MQWCVIKKIMAVEETANFWDGLNSSAGEHKNELIENSQLQ